ncbi:MAG TPA: glycosyltransferase family 4 protein [Marmoricola sp.]|nr:glycosyltransferase family 4 protein [Marmoricola sp.]
MTAQQPQLERRITIDVTNQRAGGGLQVALSTLEAIGDDVAVRLVCLNSGPLEKVGRSRGWQVVVRRDSRMLRALRQLAPKFLRNRDIDASVVYTVFGPPMRGPRIDTTIVGVAYSNLFYPELNFWRNENLGRRLARRVRDSLRLRAILKADALVFETEATRSRAVQQHPQLKSRSTMVMPPAPRAEFDGIGMGRVRHPRAVPQILLASSWHPNKNLEMVPYVAAAMRDMGAQGIFALTLVPQSDGARRLSELARDLGVEERIKFIGRINPHEMTAAVGASDCILLISELESFSNNVIEALAAGVPLVVSDRDWARSAAGAAALYCDPTSAPSVARAVMRATSDVSLRESLATEGREVLKRNFLAPDRRAEAILQFCWASMREQCR